MFDSSELKCQNYHGEDYSCSTSTISLVLWSIFTGCEIIECVLWLYCNNVRRIGNPIDNSNQSQSNIIMSLYQKNSWLYHKIKIMFECNVFNGAIKDTSNSNRTSLSYYIPRQCCSAQLFLSKYYLLLIDVLLVERKKLDTLSVQFNFLLDRAITLCPIHLTCG